ELLHERIAHLHGRALALALFVEFGAGHGGAVDAVASGAGADVDDGIPHAARGAPEDAVGLEETERECVDQTVAVEGGVERDLSGDRRDADAVAVTGDAGDDLL